MCRRHEFETSRDIVNVSAVPNRKYHRHHARELFTQHAGSQTRIHSLVDKKNGIIISARDGVPRVHVLLKPSSTLQASSVFGSLLRVCDDAYLESNFLRLCRLNGGLFAQLVRLSDFWHTAGVWVFLRVGDNQQFSVGCRIAGRRRPTRGCLSV